jgi:NADPH2:quinone reductase
MEAMIVEKPGSPTELRLAEVPDPVPGPGEILVEVAYAGVGFVDTLFRAGAFALPLPLIPGIEVAGRVRAVGPGVDRFAPGDRVGALLNDFGRGPRAGGYAQLAVAHAAMAARVPDGLDLALVAAAVVNGTTAWIALHDLARVAPHDRVLVLGASGGLGGTACRVAAASPARQVIGVAGSERSRPMVPAECTDIVLAEDFAASVAGLAGGQGLDVIVDPVGGHLRELACAHLAPFGRLLVLGDASGDDRRLSADAIWLGSQQVIGLSLGGVAHLIPDRVSAALEGVLQLLARGILREPGPAIRPLQQVPQVHHELEHRTAPPKTVLSVG